MQISFKKKVLFTVIVIICFQVLFLAAAELFLRLYIHFRYGVPGNSYGIYMADKELGAVHRPNSYNTNSVINNWGFRNTEDISEQKPEGAMRIYCSGGSTTFCYNLPMEEAWPSVLQHKLRQIPGHQHDEVLNAGEICFAISHEFALAKRFIPVLKPDVVILYGPGTNEILSASVLKNKEGKDFDQLLAEKKWGVFARKLDQARFLKRNSVLVRFYDYRIKQWIGKKLTKKFRKKTASNRDPYLHPWVIENFDHTLRSYLAFLHHNGCKVIIVRYGNIGVGDRLNNWVRMLRDRAVAIGRENGAIICDLATLVEQHPRRKHLYIDIGLHVTREGAQLSANALLATLIENSEK